MIRIRMGKTEVRQGIRKYQSLLPVVVLGVVYVPDLKYPCSNIDMRLNAMAAPPYCPQRGSRHQENIHRTALLLHVSLD